MGDQTKNLLIGVFVLSACALVIWLILFLKPTVGDGKQVIYARFSDINQIHVGTRVLFAGKPVGEVTSIKEFNESRAEPSTDIVGNLYYYQLGLKIDSHIKVYDTDEISIQTSGLLGEKSVVITPKPIPKGVTPKLITDQVIYADSADAIQRVFSEVADLACDMQKTFKEITNWMQKNGEDVASTFRSATTALDEIAILTHCLSELGVPNALFCAIENVSDTFCEAKIGIRELNDGDAFKNASAMLANWKNTSYNVESLTKEMAEGRGTLGKLIKGDDLYLHLIAVLTKIDALMNDVNHYGVLFHLNKSWQRTRLQRVTLLNSLDTPNNFKNYFECEVDQINTAMGRLSMLIDRMQDSSTSGDILCDPLFRKDFAELLRQTDDLSNNLKLYNQQLIEAQEPCCN